jgi:hypothetical protein
MPAPIYQTASGFKTLEELQSSVEHCVALVRYAKAVEDAATEVVAARSVLLEIGTQYDRRSSRTSCMIVAAISSIDLVVDDNHRMPSRFIIRSAASTSLRQFSSAA